jgi:hypothetical protein
LKHYAPDFAPPLTISPMGIFMPPLKAVYSGSATKRVSKLHV